MCNWTFFHKIAIISFMSRLLFNRKKTHRLFALCCIALGSFLLFSAPASAANPKVFILGDEMTNGYGLKTNNQQFSSQLAAFFADDTESKIQKMDITDISPNGNTLANVASMIGDIIAQRPDIVILMVGTNDALQEESPDVVYSNLDTILTELERNGIFAVLVGVEAPGTSKHVYAARFNQIFPAVAANHQVVYLQGAFNVYREHRDYTQPKTLYPTANGIYRIVEEIGPQLYAPFALLYIRLTCEPYRNDRDNASWICGDYLK